MSDTKPNNSDQTQEASQTSGVRDAAPAAEPSARRGVLRSVGRGMFYPFARVGEQMAQSRQNIAELRRQTRERQRQRMEQERLQMEELRQQGHDVQDDRGRFEALYQANGWTPEKLQEQLRVLILTRRFALAGAGLGLMMAIGAIIFQSNRWLVFLMCMVAAAICAIGLARAMQYGLQQAQVESRSLMRWREYVSREDFFAHLFS